MHPPSKPKVLSNFSKFERNKAHTFSISYGRQHRGKQGNSKRNKKKNTKKGSGQWFQFLFILVLFVKSDILKKKIKNWSLPSDSDRIGPWIDEEEERRRIYINIFSLSFVLNVGLIALDHAINLVKFVVSVILPVGLYDEKGGHYSLAMHLVNTKKEIMYFVFSSQFFFFFIFLSS